MPTRQMADVSSILQHTPNGVVLVDQHARIQFANPAFRRMFAPGEEELIGREAAKLVHSDCFEQAIASGSELTAPQWCGIFVDTTEEERARAELQQLKQETLARAEEVINRQMHTAQEIAGLLGETTAETKALLVRLMDLFRQEETP